MTKAIDSLWRCIDFDVLFTAQTRASDRCEEPYTDIWLNESLTFNKLLHPEWPPKERCPVSSQLNCHGKYCSEFRVTELTCTRNGNT